VEVEIAGRHFEVTDPIRAHVQKRVDKLPRYDEKIHSLRVTLELDSRNQNVEIAVNCHNATLIAHGSSYDMYLSIDKAFDKMERQVQRLHDKLRGHGSRT